MSNTQIVLKIYQDKFWYNESDFVPIGNTNIPYKHMTFRSNRSIYWLVEMLNFNKELGRLSVDVINYDLKQYSGFSTQKPSSAIKILVFGKFVWERLEPLLSIHQKSKLIDRLYGENQGPYSHLRTQGINEVQRLKNMEFVSYEEQQQVREVPELPIPQNLEFSEQFEIDFLNCKFGLGYVEFMVKIQTISESCEIRVYNENLLPEFDNIKKWFSRRLGKEKFEVLVNFKFYPSGELEYLSTSHDIDKINTELIDGIRILRTHQLAKAVKSKEQQDKMLYTSEDIYSLISENEGNVFNQNESEIIDVLINTSGVRNKTELQFLATNKQSVNHRIRFTTQPHFGFLFTVEGSISNHFVWELLESHATYIWTIPRSVESVDFYWTIIDNEIKEIFDIGREKYKSSYRDLNNNKNFSLNTIHHRESIQASEDIHSKWIKSINSILK